MLYILFYWGIYVWVVYGMIVLVLVYFGFCYKLLFVLCFCFYLLLKDCINGKVGDVIDVMLLFVILFGIIIILGFGVL